MHDWGTRYVISAPILVAELGFVQGSLGNVLGLVATGPGEPVLLREKGAQRHRAQHWEAWSSFSEPLALPDECLLSPLSRPGLLKESGI